MAGWQERLARLASRVEETLDQHKERLGSRTGEPRPARIEAYRGFGSADRAFVKGRVLRGRPVPPGRANDPLLLNLAGMIQRFESDEVPGARVRVRFPGGEHEVVADEEGFFEAWVDPRPAFGAGRLWHELELELVHPREDGPLRVPGPVLVPPPQSAFGVISDIDDTVVRTDATHLVKMLRNTFLGNARTRVPFPGVAAFYRALQQGMGETPFNPIFYVSSSPWNLHDVLSEFLTLQKIPVGPLMLRDWGLSRSEGLPTGHGTHKLAQIRRVMDLYPALPFLLIGDSGQEDPEIYHQVVHDYPDRVLAVYIRNVTARPERADAVRALGDEVERAGSTLLLADDTLAAARHAAGRGWITPAAVAEIEAECAGEMPDEAPEPGAARVNESLSTTEPPA
jgi:phosphatidate phosphatase APP1